MPVNPPSPHRDEAMQALRLGMSIKDCAKRFEISEKTARRYLKKINELPKNPQLGKTGGQTQSEGGKVATVTTPKPAAVVFTLSNRQIELDPEALLESYILYEDIKVKCSLSDGFSDVIRDGIGLIWQVLVNKPRIEGGKVRVEVTNGAST